ncbi:putative RNA-dependent RNA polymerase [Gremmeniella mitovirus S1]|uniref:RNA-dependent RNA polymerase n=1 Tax=Gremmeniella mitovirus S1 TaxID=204819 RepID=A0ACA5W1N2_9VIRU|nr:putative RNA-dependent RNA polymerase [Gremmeniella mitovirus S1]AAN05635.1 putative RNA-dependent RNA polymerase [Gremmeniella mitovirus S1]
MNKNLFQIVIKLFVMIFLNTDVKLFVSLYFKCLTKHLKHHGIVSTVKIFKQIRLHVTRYLCGSPLRINSMMIGIDKDGWPKMINFLKPLANGTRSDKQLLLSILFITRSFVEKDKSKLVPDWSTITQPRTTQKEYIIPSGFIKDWVLNNHLGTYKSEFDDSNHFVSVKSSPTGPSTLTALWGLWNHSYESFNWLFKITSLSGVDYLTKIMNWTWLKDLGNKKNNKWSKQFLGSLSLIYDPECKVRIVAMLDYTTQLFLRPIHNDLFKLLKKLPQDRTFTQNPLNDWEDNEHSFWSIDLTAATDRFPISLQRRLLLYIYSDPEIANSWQNLLVHREYARNGLNPIKYSVGQPMGAYSSWPAFTLSHHLVVHWCAHLCNINKFKDYIILGDDIVIHNDNIAKKYIEIMGKLGVGLSNSKTHVSKDTYEFAKRWIHKGQEISPLPITGIVNNITNPYIVLMNLYDFFKIKRNQYNFSGDILTMLLKLYQGLKIYKGDKSKKHYYLSLNRFKNLDIFLFALNNTFGYSTYDHKRSFLISKDYSKDLPGPKIMQDLISYVISTGLSNLTVESVNKSLKFVDTIIDNKNLLNIEDPNDLSNLPLFKGFQAYISNLRKTVEGWNNKSISLIEASRGLVQMDILPIMKGSNRKILELQTIGKIYQNGIQEINNSEFEIFGSSQMIHPNESLGIQEGSSLNSFSSLSSSIDTNLVFIQNELNVIAKKNWMPPATEDSVADSYAAFAAMFN